jgi:hypothetical protein
VLAVEVRGEAVEPKLTLDVKVHYFICSIATTSTNWKDLQFLTSRFKLTQTIIKER